MISYQPIEVISLPNYFSSIDKWELKYDVASTLYARLTITDKLGERRYIPSSGSIVKITFMRSRSYAVGGYDSEVQTFSVNGFIEGTDRSIVGFNLTKEQVNKIYPGTVIIELTENSSTQKLSKSFIIGVTKIGPGC